MHQVPCDFETKISLPRGELWLYSSPSVNPSRLAPEYKLYTEDVALQRLLSDDDFNGAHPCARYGKTFASFFGLDFIVQSFAINQVLKLASQNAELF